MSDSDAVVARHREFISTFATQDLEAMADFVITSYSIHYTKLYETSSG